MNATDILAAIAPNLSGLPASQMMLSLAATLTSKTAFCCDVYELAVALRAAHMLELSARSGAYAGFVSSRREGELGLGTQNTVKNGDYPDLAQTQYGVQLIGLIRGSIPFVLTDGMFDAYQYIQNFQPGIPSW